MPTPQGSIEMTKYEYDTMPPSLKSADVIAMKLVPLVFANGKWLIVKDPEQERARRDAWAREYARGRR